MFHQIKKIHHFAERLLSLRVGEGKKCGWSNKSIQRVELSRFSVEKFFSTPLTNRKNGCLGWTTRDILGEGRRREGINKLSLEFEISIRERKSEPSLNWWDCSCLFETFIFSMRHTSQIDSIWKSSQIYLVLERERRDRKKRRRNV